MIKKYLIIYYTVLLFVLTTQLQKRIQTICRIKIMFSLTVLFTFICLKTKSR